MPDEWPKGWVKTTLGDIAEPTQERVLPGEVPGMRYVGLEHVEPQTMKLLGHANASDVRSSSLLFSKGDVLYGKMRPYLNKVWVAEFDGICSTEFLVFLKHEGLNNHFLAMRLNAQDFVNFANGQISGERPRVNFDKLSSFRILLPPFLEQERIVTKLNTVISGLQRADAESLKARERLDDYRASLLNDAITGRLTRQWRKINRKNQESPIETGEALLKRLLAIRRLRWEETERKRLRAAGKSMQGDEWKSRYHEPPPPDVTELPKLPKEWAWASAEQLTEAIRPITYGVIKLGNEIESGVPVLRSSDVRPLRIELHRVKRIAKRVADKYQRTYLKGGEVLVTIRGTLGGVAAVPDKCAGYNISREVAMLALLEPRSSRAVAYFVGAQVLQRWLHMHRRGIAHTGINIETVRALPIPVPPLDEQDQIVRELDRRLSAADDLASRLDEQLARSSATRQLLLREAFVGRLVPQDQNDEPASVLLERMRVRKAQAEGDRKQARRKLPSTRKKRRDAMQKQPPSPESLTVAWERMGRKAGARGLFDEVGCGPDHVVQFYDALRAAPGVREAFQETTRTYSRPLRAFDFPRAEHSSSQGRFRLILLWLEDYKNLRNYTIHFDPGQSVDIILGWNGTGKSNLFEALVIIFRDLHEWLEKNRWPDNPMKGYRLKYEIDEQMVEIVWRPGPKNRPQLKKGPIDGKRRDTVRLERINRDQLPLPRFVFGYYSGPTNRLCEHFLPMKQAHYYRLLKAETDDAATLANLLEQRRFFCAETHQAKYVLLAFLYKEDPKISKFLEDRLRIVGFESVLFVIRKPRWAKHGSKAEDFWGATGIMRQVMERLRRYAIAPMVLEQTVSYGYRSSKEDHYYFFLPDLESLHSFAAEYQDARTFFLALESTDFSELIHDVKIQVRIKANNAEETAITFYELSEGEQQLLMVLGLMRFTKSHQSLVLLDEPDTHLNPHWSVDYLKQLVEVMSNTASESPEQQSSQILMATHDPLVIASLVKQQIHLFKRDWETGACKWVPSSVNPRGLGYTGILTSEMFGFRSDLDQETLAELDAKVRLTAKEGTLTSREKEELEQIDKKLAETGFANAFSDPYYAAFVRAWGRRYSELMAGELFLTPEKKQEIDRIASEVLAEAVAEVEEEVTG